MYTIHYEYFGNVDDHVNISKLSILVLIIGLASLVIIFVINEIIHWQEIR